MAVIHDELYMVTSVRFNPPMRPLLTLRRVRIAEGLDTEITVPQEVGEMMAKEVGSRPRPRVSLTIAMED